MNFSKILVFSDVSFSRNNDESSQVRYIIQVSGRKYNENKIDFSSKNCRRDVRSFLVAETFVTANTCDAAVVIQHHLTMILKKKIKIKILIDCETPFHVVISKSSIIERILIIYIKAAREAYSEVIVIDIMWIRREYNKSYAMNNHTILPQLVACLQTGNARIRSKNRYFAHW